MWLDEKQIIYVITSPQKPVPRKGLLEKKKKKSNSEPFSFQISQEKILLLLLHTFFPANSNKMKTKGLFKTVVSGLHSADLQPQVRSKAQVHMILPPQSGWKTEGKNPRPSYTTQEG